MNRNDPSIPPMGRHRYEVRVYYEDTDAGGVVYHANFLRFAERARTEALRDMGLPHAAMTERFSLMFMVQRIEVEYQRPARLDDSLTVETEVLTVRGASALLRQTVIGPHGPCAVLGVRLACVQPATARPDRLPTPWREALEAMREARLAAKGITGGGNAPG
jgi:acyl-CoA thioester hydrolase